MGYQAVAADVAPWLGVVTGTLAIVGLVARAVGPGRLRANLASDAELVKTLDGAAKMRVQSAVDHQALRLWSRVKYGPRLSPLGDLAFDLTVLLLSGVALMALGVVEARWWNTVAFLAGFACAAGSVVSLALLFVWRLRGMPPGSRFSKLLDQRKLEDADDPARTPPSQNAVESPPAAVSYRWRVRIVREPR